MHDLAARLNAFVAGQAAPYGKEYSVRWRNGIADRDRFLLSIHREAIASSAAEAHDRSTLSSFLFLLAVVEDLEPDPECGVQAPLLRGGVIP